MKRKREPQPEAESLRKLQEKRAMILAAELLLQEKVDIGPDLKEKTSEN